jgi:hypothetical protein
MFNSNTDGPYQAEELPNDIFSFSYEATFIFLGQESQETTDRPSLDWYHNGVSNIF